MKLIIILLFSVSISSASVNHNLHKQYNWFFKYHKEVKYYASKYDLCPVLICAIIERESRGNRYAIGRAGERGLMQPMTYHYKGNLLDLHIPSVNLDVACKYLKRAYIKARGDIRVTARLYNGGLNSKPKRYKNWKYVNDVERLYFVSN